METVAPMRPASDDVVAGIASRPRLADFITLTKPRVNALVVATTAGGFYLGSGENLDVVRLVNAVAGTWLVAASAAAFNQVIERDKDALMRRTCRRPLPEARLQPASAVGFAILLGTLGLAQIAAGTTLLAAGVALATVIVYVGLYTPLKRYSSVATLVGAVAGGLPPVIGWAAARNDLALEAWVLFAVIFLWQMPHFLAIAWMCRDDYVRARFPLLPVIDPGGRATASQMILYAAMLVPVSLLVAALGVAGRFYFATALVLGISFLCMAIRFGRRRTLENARQLFLGSVVYLPLVWAVMMIDRV